MKLKTFLSFDGNGIYKNKLGDFCFYFFVLNHGKNANFFVDFY